MGLFQRFRGWLVRPILIVLAVLAVFSAPTLALAQPRVLLLASDTPSWAADVQSKLAATGRFAVVDTINASTTTPSLATLQTYDAVLVWHVFFYQNADAVGDVLADYIDGGGGVVVAVFSTAGSANRRPGGRFAAGGYGLIDYNSQVTGQATLGTVLLPGDALMAGVATFDGGSLSYRPQPGATVRAGAIRVANWSDGAPLVVKQQIGNRYRVDLGFLPPSSTVDGSFWAASTDGTALMANALVVASQPVQPPPVPTMTEWAMILFGTLLAGGAALYIQRRGMAI